MYNSRKVIVVLLASGNSTRFGENIPKQFFELKGKPVMAYSLSTFDSNDFVDEIIVVSNPSFLDITRNICKGFGKVSNIVLGGETRSISSRNGIMAIDDKNSYVLIHDSARPFVSNELIKRLLDNVEDTGAVIPCVKLSDSIAQINDNKVIDIPDRNKFLRIQTPQCFKYEVIFKAYYLSKEEFIDYLDDSSLVIKHNLANVKFVEGDDFNIKLTTKHDLVLANFLFDLKLFYNS